MIKNGKDLKGDRYSLFRYYAGTGLNERIKTLARRIGSSRIQAMCVTATLTYLAQLTKVFSHIILDLSSYHGIHKEGR
jgi:hypothetical protein